MIRPHPDFRASSRRAIAAAAPLLFLLFLLAPTGCSDRASSDSIAGYQLVPVTRGELIVTASASGSIEPVRVVEVKSKASGEILRMPVESGDRVERGAILVDLDRDEVRSSLAQAEADVEEARVRLRVAEARLTRSSQLSEAGLQSEEEHENVVLEHAQARTQLVKAENVLDLAKERFADATVRAPITGRVITKEVEEGQIISSATTQVSDGTLLLTMADLTEVQIRTLVDETDIGLIQAGQEAEVTVDAYPRRRFLGRVIKVEPQAVIEQNVTTFPVLVRIPNEDGLLLPGMNADVEVRIDRRENVLTVPNEAIRSEKDAIYVAGALGMDSDVAEAALRSEERQSGRSVGIVFKPVDSGDSSASDAGSAAARFRLIRVELGLRNWNETEVLSGLEEGDRVVVTLSTGLLRQQEQMKERAERWGGMPGMKKDKSKSQ
ncbi:MAG: efflux RND transporter periplasmic adaptor subunit [Candidatus Eisenbacteria bacterium]|nr:efflux RND transporter periplasmic adaptor subunit [Candidatus Eisenbacteria bacterium]